MIATFAAMALLYMLFAKFVPIISIWELKVGNQPHPVEVVDAEDDDGRAVEGASVKAVYGLYSDPDTAQRAVDGLRAAGVAEQRHRGDVVRAVRGVRVQPSRQARRGCTGLPAPAASIGLLAGYWLTSDTPAGVADRDQRHADRRDRGRT